MPKAQRKPEQKEGKRAFSGLVILAVLVGLALTIVSLDEITAARVETVEYAALLPAAGGLVSGAPVWIAGREVGEVVTVGLMPPAADSSSRVAARIRIPAAFAELIRADSRARLTSARIMAAAVLEISPGTAAAPRLEEGDTVLAAFAPDQLDRSLASARRLFGEVDSLLANLSRVGQLWDARRPRVVEMRESLAAAGEELERTVRLYRAGPLPATLRDAELRERLERVRLAMAQLQEGLGRYSEGPLAGNVEALRARAVSLQEELAELDSAASDPSGFVGRFGADSAISVEAGRTSAQMDTLVEEILSNPFQLFF